MSKQIALHVTCAHTHTPTPECTHMPTKINLTHILTTSLPFKVVTHKNQCKLVNLSFLVLELIESQSLLVSDRTELAADLDQRGESCLTATQFQLVMKGSPERQQTHTTPGPSHVAPSVRLGELTGEREHDYFTSSSLRASLATEGHM